MSFHYPTTCLCLSRASALKDYLKQLLVKVGRQVEVKPRKSGETTSPRAVPFPRNSKPRIAPIMLIIFFVVYLNILSEPQNIYRRKIE
jgi:hypothetical protein